LVVDASALAFALTDSSRDARELRKRLRGTTCHAPHLVDAEFGNVLRKQVARGDIGSARAFRALRRARDVVAHRYSHTGALGDAAWLLRGSLAFYDALYVALAARLGVRLVTADVRLTRAPGLTCAVEPV
jgi:predicted nucleic acid-binding protein